MAPRVTPLADGIGACDEGDSRAMDDIVRRAQGGDVDAFEMVYRTHLPAIHALCIRMCGDAREADELVQDAFVRAWEKLGSFRGQSALATWLHALAVNVVLERWRSAKRDALRMVDDPEGLAMNSVATDPDTDARMDLAVALRRLSAGARAVFVLHDIEGYAHDEIATMTGIAAGTSRAQLFRARRALARMLAL